MPARAGLDVGWHSTMRHDIIKGKSVVDVPHAACTTCSSSMSQPVGFSLSRPAKAAHTPSMYNVIKHISADLALSRLLCPSEGVQHLHQQMLQLTRRCDTIAKLTCLVGCSIGTKCDHLGASCVSCCLVARCHAYCLARCTHMVYKVVMQGCCDCCGP
jgi:hypothetical protein